MEVPILLPKIFNHPFTYLNYSQNIKNLNQGDIVIVPFGQKNEVEVECENLNHTER